ncbi:sn-glycerol-3-phosphate ABC transporter ATP-binding protein UgpC [Pseudovibrio sp. Tun.PSC04-5.I4]|uniref:ABC transporter ATP-binding protein n=1 Tax=Pseudovibrio sp. Tun.PSC04-5.I4 TaxID=1798213 RepID=UPI000891C6C4|nr:sn-glycerol-3-phosphate ABC transporter ATP-binding protein UgpC [Pseudovibrio sp. Tun.PSC04-5.I4]SDR13987.1 carbohydrate ABC transporter ATP-binding protein, CUT1 family [Pseudovibrio sp. Tun.PSC04-5.I4]
MTTVSLNNLRKSYGDTQVLHGINLDIHSGEFVVLVGPSGCGKSTTLRMIAGLEEVSGGDIRIGGNIVNDMEPKERDIAMVFQNYAIYPHMSVRKNIGFGLRTSKLSKPEKEARIEEVSTILELTDLLDRKPNQLSGGQRQRVAIGRAMVRDPAAFLFDEPLSNLDAQLRTQMRLEIKKLHQKVGNTVIFVTHDQVEAMTMADRIVIMKDGHIQQVGTPFQVFYEPANIFVAQFIGAPSMNMMKGVVKGDAIRLDNGTTIKAPMTKLSEGQKITVGLRPDALLVQEGEGLFSGVVSVIEPLGTDTLAYVTVRGKEVIAKASGRTPPAVGDSVNLHAAPEAIHLFATDTGEAIR